MISGYWGLIELPYCFKVTDVLKILEILSTSGKKKYISLQDYPIEK